MCLSQDARRYSLYSFLAPTALGDVMSCVRPSVRYNPQKNIENEFKQHSKESRGGSSKQVYKLSKQAGNQGSRQVSTQADK